MFQDNNIKKIRELENNIQASRVRIEMEKRGIKIMLEDIERLKERCKIKL